MVADIPSIDLNPEVVRLGRLIATYKARLVELAAMRRNIAMADEAANTVARAEALASGGAYQAVRTTESIDDEAVVVRAAIKRIERQMVDARSVAVLTISKQCRLPERAAASRVAVAAHAAALMAALDEAQALADAMDAAEISPTGLRWPGCGAPTIVESLAGLRIDCGVNDAETLLMLERRAGIRVEPAFVMQDRPAPAKPTMRRKIADKFAEIGEQMLG